MQNGPSSVNVVRMDQELIEKIATAIAAEERTLSWVADKTGIARVTLGRKMKGGASFTVPEVARIAEALKIEPASLLPAPFISRQVAA